MFGKSQGEGTHHSSYWVDKQWTCRAEDHCEIYWWRSLWWPSSSETFWLVYLFINFFWFHWCFGQRNRGISDWGICFPPVTPPWKFQTTLSPTIFFLIIKDFLLTALEINSNICVTEKLTGQKLEVPEVTQSEAGQKQKLEIVLAAVNKVSHLILFQLNSFLCYYNYSHLEVRRNF